MLVHRITAREFANDLSGTGAMLFGGRWNQPGVRMLYTSSSLSLAALETIVNSSSSRIKNGFYCVEIVIPEVEIQELKDLPAGWNNFPYTAGTVKIGNDFIQKNGFCLRVPSAVIPTEFNFLINPHHDLFNEVKIQDVRPMIFDQRLTS